MKNLLLKHLNFESLITLFSQAPVALAMLMGDEQTVEVANSKLLELWGKDQSVIGLPLLEALPEIRDQEFPSILKKVYETGVPFNGYGVLAKLVRNGVITECYFDFVYSPIWDYGKITGVSVVATEVTEKVKSQLKLRESELRFRNLMEISDYSTAIYHGEDLVIEFANKQMIKTWGKDSSVIGKRLEDALPELAGQPFVQILRDVYRTGKSYVAKEDKVDLVVDGVLQTFYYNFSYKALRNEYGEIYAIMNVAMNVTELVQARENLRLRSEEYSTLAEAMPQMVWTASPDRKILYANNNMCTSLGSTPKELLSLDFTQLVHPNDVRQLIQDWKAASQSQQDFELEFRMAEAATGKYMWFLSRAKPVIVDGIITKWVGTCTNINEFKNLSTQKDTFLGIASHELKTPLTSLKLYAQVLERMMVKSGDEKNADLARKMDLQVVKLTSLISDLLDVTKINAGKILLNEDYFCFDELIKETIEEQQMSTVKTIETDFENTGTVFADKERTAQVMTNLISNAIKYSPEADRIIVSSKVQDGNVVFSVQDFGIGMPADKLEKVFDQYYRVAEDQKNTFPGLGLGLYIAAEIIERSNGKIWVESELNRGSTFYFSLPLAQND